MRHALLAVALWLLGALPAGAQFDAPGAPVAPAMQRRITVHLRDVALRDALDRVAALADVRLSYSGENLPLDRRVSLARDTTSLSDVLDELLRPFAVQPVVVAADHIVLAPRPPTSRDTAGRGIAVLDRVVVTGSVIGTSERSVPVALDIVRGREAERRDETQLARLLDGAVPGIWLWEQAPTSLLASYGSIRGASSFGLSYPKVYVDGIEVANPLLLTQITPELVERVEVIRGPQGAALYGSDAISGVVNIVSRHEGRDASGAHALLRTQAGYVASGFSPNAVAVQQHTLTLRGGSNLRSAGLTVGVSTTGEYVPQAYSRELRTLAQSRVVGDHSTFTASARFYAKDAGVAPNPLLAALRDRIRGDSSPQQLRMYAAGSTLTIAPDDRWTYTMTAGLDGYRLSNATTDLGPIPSAADSALRDARGSAVRGTMRASAVSAVGAPDRASATLTLAAEHSALRDETAGELTPQQIAEDEDRPADLVTGWTSSTGVSAQANLALRNAAFLSAGIRGEHIGQTHGLPQSAALPMLGVALVRDLPHATVKLRGAYGKGIRAPRTTMHIMGHEGRMLANPFLRPEQQAGTEAGIDVILARVLGAHLTRFDQRASGLIQTTVAVIDSTNSGGPGTRPVYAYQLQNVGEITNRGWEAQLSLSLRSLSLGGAASFVDSRVERLAAGYTGDLRPGDRMLAVPSRTWSGTAAWTGRHVDLSATVARASDWINYDRLAIADTVLRGADPHDLIGAKLRQYWARFGGATRLRASMAVDIRSGLQLNLTGENLLNYQLGEPDSITIVPGRTIIAGLRARF